MRCFHLQSVVLLQSLLVYHFQIEVDGRFDNLTSDFGEAHFVFFLYIKAAICPQHNDSLLTVVCGTFVCILMQFVASSRDLFSVYSSICIWEHEVCLFCLQYDSPATEGHVTPLQSVTVSYTGRHILTYFMHHGYYVGQSSSSRSLTSLTVAAHFIFHHIYWMTSVLFLIHDHEHTTVSSESEDKWALWNMDMNFPTQSSCTIRPHVLEAHREKLTGKLVITNTEYHENLLATQVLLYSGNFQFALSHSEVNVFLCPLYLSQTHTHTHTHTHANKHTHTHTHTDAHTDSVSVLNPREISVLLLKDVSSSAWDRLDPHFPHLSVLLYWQVW